MRVRDKKATREDVFPRASGFKVGTPQFQDFYSTEEMRLRTIRANGFLNKIEKRILERSIEIAGMFASTSRYSEEGKYDILIID